MRVPRPIGTAISAARMRGWISNFASYRYQVSEGVINDWLSQFGDDREVAARLLDVVDFYSIDRVSAAYRAALASLPGWDIDPDRREGKWRFAAMSRSAGESGDAMLHRFRVANKLDASRYNELFIHPSQILLSKLGADDTLVLVDDFVGTGQSVKNAWDASYQELVTEVGRVYLVVAVACSDGADLLQNNTSIRCVPAHVLTGGDNFFSDQNGHFSEKEKVAVLAKCRKAQKSSPKGFGDCGLVLVFSHRCPNNSLPVLHAESDKWTALFPRHG